MPYGLDATGFTIKPTDAILADVAARQHAHPALGPNQDTSETSALGGINMSVAGDLALLWELASLVWQSNDPDGALDVPLENVASLTGTTKRAASATKVRGVQLSLNAGITVTAGATVSVDGRPDITCTLDETATNPGGSPAVILGNFTCTQTGPIVINAGTLTEIDTPVVGWTAVTNPSAGSTGRPTDSNLTLRARRVQQIALRGGSTLDAIRADLLDAETTPALETIEAVLMLENVGTVPDVNGLPPGSIEAIIDDGPTPSVDNDVIAQVIWTGGKGGGIRAYGLESGTAVDAAGHDQVVGFSRVARHAIYISATLTTGAGFPVDGVAQVKAKWAERGGAYDVSDDVIALFVRAAAFEVPGVVDVPTFLIGLAPSPTEDDNIPMGYRERATFDVANMVIT